MLFVLRYLEAFQPSVLVTRSQYNKTVPPVPRIQMSVTYNTRTYTIQEIQVVAPPKLQVYTGALCGGQKDLSLNMHSQQSMNYTQRAAMGGRGQRLDSRAVALRAAHRSRQGSRAWGRSLIGELTLHRARAGPRRHANTGMAPGRRPSPHYRSSRRDGARWRGRAARGAQARSSG